MSAPALMPMSARFDAAAARRYDMMLIDACADVLRRAR